MITILGKSKLRTSDLRDIPIVTPAGAGPRWKPIPHYELATSLQDELWSRRIGIATEGWAVDPTGQVLVGGFNLHIPGRAEMPGMVYALGIRHSNNQKHALTFAVGATVTVCLNGLITGTWVLRKKHTTGLELREAVREGIGRFEQEVGAVARTAQEMQARTLTTRQVDHILMSACRRNALPWSHARHVWEEYNKPRHDVFRPRTAWSLYNAFSEDAKNRNPATQIDALDTFREIVLN